MSDTVKGLGEIKGDDLNIVVRLKKFGQYLKKIDVCCSGRFGWTKSKLHF